VVKNQQLGQIAERDELWTLLFWGKTFISGFLVTCGKC